jgi:anthranilate synthase component 1
MTLNLTELEVAELARESRVIPLIDTLFSGTETPVGLFQKLCGERSGTFLLESADQGVWSRYSFIGVESRGSMSKASGEAVRWSGEAPALPSGELDLSEGSLSAINAMVSAWSTPKMDSLPPLTSGLVGMFGWDVIREIEHLPNRPKVDYRVPEMWFSMFSDLVIVDHQTSELQLVANIFIDDDAVEIAERYDDAKSRLDKLRALILQPTKPFVAELEDQGLLALNANQTKTEFLESVELAKAYIRRGDVFQVVLSQRFDQALKAAPLDVYRALRALNPSPYMYLLQQSDEAGPYSIVGSSPEALVTVSAGNAVMHPIAGSRPRGITLEDDQKHEASLIKDEKERAEHLMLVDLARNDLLKVCESDSIAVTEFMGVHRFSHIMHLVSTVEGRLRENQTAVDVFRATFPAGTLSGAPKPRALEIIDELEPSSRGLFGGVVGYFDFAGSADLAIAIRTAFLRDGLARIQAGAGLVLDSDPISEFEETRTKAAAPARAVAAANGFGEA